ncbi:MAG: hypothetical protein GY778_22255 [bacterium]|nr:hypothetical protein [bacterium]
MAKQADLWRDRRSGRAGRIAGNLVLSELAHRFREKIHHRKGTTFVSTKHLYVARACGTADYLAKDEAHWCNLSPAQHNEVVREARKQGQKLLIVFITATPDKVHYWRVPASVTARILSRLTPKPSDKSCFLRIRRRENRFFLEDEDVTKYHTVLEPDDADAAELTAALLKPREPRRSPAASPSSQDEPEISYATDVRLQRVFQYGNELAVLLPRTVAEQTDLSVGSLVQASTSSGAILLHPVEVVPKLATEDQRFTDELFRRRRTVFEALAE